MSILSKSSAYGLRASMYVAASGERGFVSIGKISSDLDISFHFLTKILQKLTRAGIMSSHRGPTGGVALAKPARKISVLDIVEAVEGPGFLKACVLGLSGCGDKTPCPMHSQWAKERKRIRTVFSRTPLSQLTDAFLENTLRLAD
jgi:Rrf2 family transcriptional regulator, iron-sulfur cluster assembly transcription factor